MDDKSESRLSAILQNVINTEVNLRSGDLNLVEQNINSVREALNRLRQAVCADFYDDNFKTTLQKPPHRALKNTFVGKRPIKREAVTSEDEGASTSFDVTSRIETQSCDITNYSISDTTKIKQEKCDTEYEQSPKEGNGDELGQPGMKYVDPDEKVSLSSEVEKGPRYVPPVMPIEQIQQSVAPRMMDRMKKVRFLVRNNSKYIENCEGARGAIYKWTVYVGLNDESLDISQLVSKVVFYLHPSYRPNDVITIGCPPFKITRRGWGEFDIRTKIFFINEADEPVDIMHAVVFDKLRSGMETFGGETVYDHWITSPSMKTDAILEHLPSPKQPSPPPPLSPKKSVTSEDVKQDSFHYDVDNFGLKSEERESWDRDFSNFGDLEFTEFFDFFGNETPQLTTEGTENKVVVTDSSLKRSSTPTSEKLPDLSCNAIDEPSEKIQSTSSQQIETASETVDYNFIECSSATSDRASVETFVQNQKVSLAPVLTTQLDHAQSCTGDKHDVTESLPEQPNELESFDLDDILGVCNEVVITDTCDAHGNDQVDKGSESIGDTGYKINDTVCNMSVDDATDPNHRIVGSLEKIVDSSHKVSEPASNIEPLNKVGSSSYKIDTGLGTSREIVPTIKVNDTDFKAGASMTKVVHSSFKVSESVGKVGESCYKIGGSSYKIVDTVKKVGDSGFKIVDSTYKVGSPIYKVNESANKVVDPPCNVGSSNYIVGGSVCEIGESPNKIVNSSSGIDDSDAKEDLIDYNNIEMDDLIKFPKTRNTSCKRTSTSARSQSIQTRARLVTHPVCVSVSKTPVRGTVLMTSPNLSALPGGSTRVVLSGKNINLASPIRSCSPNVLNVKNVGRKVSPMPAAAVKIVPSVNVPIVSTQSSSKPVVVGSVIRPNALASKALTATNQISSKAPSAMGSGPSVVRPATSVTTPLQLTRKVIKISPKNVLMGPDGAKCFIKMPDGTLKQINLKPAGLSDIKDLKLPSLPSSKPSTTVAPVSVPVSTKRTSSTPAPGPPPKCPALTQVSKGVGNILQSVASPKTYFQRTPANVPSTHPQAALPSRTGLSNIIVADVCPAVPASSQARPPMTVTNETPQGMNIEKRGPPECEEVKNPYLIEREVLVDRCPKCSPESGVVWLLKKFPLIDERASFESFKTQVPYCAPNYVTFCSWPLGKRRAHEIQRAADVVEVMEAVFPECKWTKYDILKFARLRGFAPHSRTVDPNFEPTLPLSLPDTPTMFDSSKFESMRDLDSEEVVDVISTPEGNSYKPSRHFKEPTNFLKGKTLMTLHRQVNEATFVEKLVRDVSIYLDPEEIVEGVVYPAALRVLMSAFSSFAEDLIRRSYTSGYLRYDSSEPALLLCEDVRLALRSRPEFDLFTNEGTGISRSDEPNELMNPGMARH